MNCSSSRLALIDAPGILTLLDLEARISEDEERLDVYFTLLLHIPDTHTDPTTRDIASRARTNTQTQDMTTCIVICCRSYI